MKIIRANIKGNVYWLQETGKGNLYQWIGLIQNATPLHEIEAAHWVRYLKRHSVSLEMESISC